MKPIIARTTIVAAITLLAALPAEAQFGGLKKKIQKAAGGEAAAEVGAVAPAPEFDIATVEMTGERLDKIIAVAPKIDAMYQEMMKPVSEEEAKARDAAEDKRQKRESAYNECAEKSREQWQSGLMARMQALQAKGDVKGMQAIADSIGKAAADQNAFARQDSLRVAKACGSKPGAAPKGQLTTNDLERRLTDETQLTHTQWVTLKERLIAAMSLPRRRFEDRRASGLSEGETKAIGERYDVLKKISSAGWISSF